MAPRREDEELQRKRSDLVVELLSDIRDEQKAIRAQIEKDHEWITGARAVIDLFKWCIPFVVISFLKVLFDIISYLTK